MEHGSCNKDAERDIPAAQEPLAGALPEPDRQQQPDTQPLSDMWPPATATVHHNTAPEPPPSAARTAPVPPPSGQLLVLLLRHHSTPGQQKPWNATVPEPALPAGTKSWMKQIAWKFPVTSALTGNADALARDLQPYFPPRPPIVLSR